MVLLTKEAQSIFAPANEDGTLRRPSLQEMQVWGTEVETLAQEGAEVSDKVFTDSFQIRTGGQRTLITSGTGSETIGALLHVYNRNAVTCAIRASSYWTGSTATPYQNNDCSLWEVFNTVQSTSLNRSWAVSAANWKNAIPAGVTDTGERTGVIGWAVSVGNDASYYHAGTLALQMGVYGAAGFQGPGSPSSGVITQATGVRGYIYNDSPGATINYAFAGEFIAGGGYAGNVVNNVAVYASAAGGTGRNYAFLGNVGWFLHKDVLHVSASEAVHEGFSGNTAEATRIDTNGVVHIAKVGVDSKLNIQTLSGSGSANLAVFRWGATVTGIISHSSTTTTYQTSSDHRLPWKEGRLDLKGSAEFIDALKPYYFPLAGKSGFIAHEFAEVSPVSVSGEKDAIDDVGAPVYQQMQASTDDVLANIVAELQSLRKRIAELESV